MIRNIEELKHYIEEDKKTNKIFRKIPKIFGDTRFKYLIFFRLTQYYYFNFGKKNLIFILINYFKTHYGNKMGWEINSKIVGKGLKIPHRGPIIINSNAKIGDYCEINSMVNIGNNVDQRDKAPIIGKNVFIGPGAKIFGDIKIADGIKIGANAVVNKNFKKKGITIAGVPARIINNRKVL